MSNIYYLTENNFDGTANTYEVKDGFMIFIKKIEWPPSEGIDPEEQKGITCNIDPNDSIETVALKTDKAIKEYYSSNETFSDNRQVIIDGEYEDITPENSDNC